MVDGSTGWAEELALAQACARQEPAALARFEALTRATITATARRFGSPDFAEEVAQAVRQRLLVGEGGKPARLSEYRGQGPLLGFVQAVTVRTALNRLEAEAKHASAQGDEALLELPSGEDDPEVAALKQRYRAEFKQAFAAALGSLDQTSRSALRLYYLDGLQLADLGRLFDWSVPTASRRLAAARATLLQATRAAMADKLKLTPRELDSVLRLIGSRLSVEGLPAA